MGVLGWIVVGFVAGALRPRRSPAAAGTSAASARSSSASLGGLLGGMLFNAAGDEGIGDFGLRSMFVAFVGAVVLLALVGLVTGRGHRRRR